jgi:hypothetical protein
MNNSNAYSRVNFHYFLTTIDNFPNFLYSNRDLTLCNLIADYPYYIHTIS